MCFPEDYDDITDIDGNTTTPECPRDDIEDSGNKGNTTCGNAVCPSKNCNCKNCTGDCNCDDCADTADNSAIASAGSGETEYLYKSDEQVAMTSTSPSVQLFPNADGYQFELAQGNTEICEMTSDGVIQFNESGYVMVDVYNSEGEFVGRYGVSAYLNESGTNTLAVGRVCCYDEKTDAETGGEPDNGTPWVDLSDGRQVKYPRCRITYIENTTKPLRLYSLEEAEKYYLQEQDTELADITDDGTISFASTGAVKLSVIDRETGEEVAEYQITVIIEADGTIHYAVTIYCNADNEADKPVTVKPTSIQILAGDETATRYIGNNSFAIVTVVVPAKADQAVLFSSSNTDVATVSEDGNVTLVGLGEVDIIVQSAVEKSVYVTVSFTVVDSPDYGEVVELDDGEYIIRQEFALLGVESPSAEVFDLMYDSENTEIHETALWTIESLYDEIYIYRTNVAGMKHYICCNNNKLSIAAFDSAQEGNYRWELRYYNNIYSLHNVETDTYLCGSNGKLTIQPLELAVDYDFRWQIISTEERELYMPVCLNQYYDGIDDAYVAQYGCCLCSIGNVLSYYDTEKEGGYDINELVEQGWWVHKSAEDDQGNIEYWGEARWKIQNVVTFGPYTTVDEDLKADNYSKLRDLIRTQISLGRPVILHCDGTNKMGIYMQHWTVAYKYTLNAQDLDNVYVLDSSNNKNPNDSNGVKHSLNESMLYNYNQNIIGYKTTEPKY